MKNILSIVYNLNYVYRWSGIYNLKEENVTQHSYGVVFLTHLLCKVKNDVCNSNINIEQALVEAIYHDVADSYLTHITYGVKQQIKFLEKDFNKIKEDMTNEILDMHGIKPISAEKNLEIDEIIEAADKIDAIVKCKNEILIGNTKFEPIYKRQIKEFQQYSKQKMYLKIFCNRYLEEYLDEKLFFE